MSSGGYCIELNPPPTRFARALEGAALADRRSRLRGARAGLLLGAGTLGDHIGHRRMFLLGLVLFGIASLAAAFAFVRRQRRQPFPLLDFAIFRNRVFAAGVIAATFAMFSMAGIQLATTQRYQLVAGFSPLEAGLLVSAAALGAFPMALLGGAYLHRIGLRLLIAGGLGLAAPSALLAAWGVSQGLGWVVAGMVLGGVGVGAAMSVASTAIIGNAPVARAGMAASVEEVSYEFGGLIAVALLGSLLAAIYSAGVVLPEGTPGLARDSMAAAALLAAEGGAGTPALFSAAAAAFDRGFQVVMFVIAGVLACAALITCVLLSRYGPGSASSSYPTGH